LGWTVRRVIPPIPTGSGWSGKTMRFTCHAEPDEVKKLEGSFVRATRPGKIKPVHRCRNRDESFDE